MLATTARRGRGCFFIASSAFCCFALCAASVNPSKQAARCSLLQQQSPNVCRTVTKPFVGVQRRDAHDLDSSVLSDAFNALAVLQNAYFEPVNGTWPTSIDWTGAVIETIISGTLSTFSKSLGSVDQGSGWHEKEQLISSLFAHVTHSFFGQNAAAILQEAYDDVMWVVLGWLEAIKFIRLHSTLHYPGRGQHCLSVPTTLDSAVSTISWHGNHWVCTFADRARAFWDFATKGWDTKLCHGGMIWNPGLEPYKNAITNELWISASISMYEHFPRDQFNQTWAASKGFATNDPVYLTAAIVGYEWLKNINMTDSQGLYVDGFHVNNSKPGNVDCDLRNEKVYTYNQGVILTGQRGLFTVTGSPSYLEEGHTLIRNVINATGWDLGKNRPVDSLGVPPQGTLPPWRGIGRYGILEEACDAQGTCRQDPQTFKGIFFHHLTAFCAPLDQATFERRSTMDRDRFSQARAAHDKSCVAYLGWVRHNLDAALKTRDAAGKFGMWWGASIFKGLNPDTATSSGLETWQSSASTDYRNKGTPLDKVWGLKTTWQPGSRSPIASVQDELPRPDPKLRVGAAEPDASNEPPVVARVEGGAAGDANDRGRGRTVETQAGGLALLRAYWELSRR